MAKRTHFLDGEPTKPSPFLVSDDARKKGALKTERVAPSGLLERAMAFLPEMERANKELEQRIAQGEDVNVEAVHEGDEHVEMEIAMGEIVEDNNQ